MTALAARGSRFMNGVSRIHGDVSALILADLWPEVPEEENPISYVTNGVHAPSFVAPEMAESFERFVGSGWSHRLGQPGALDRIGAMPDHLFWSVRQHLKSRMLHLVRYQVRTQHFRNNGSEAHVDRLLKLADPANPNILTIGFARRFATYKRATLIFENLDWLREITATPSARCCSSSPARRTRPTSPARNSCAASRRWRRCPSSRGASCWSRATTCGSRREPQVVALDPQELALELRHRRHLRDAPHELLAGSSAGCALPAKRKSTGRSGSLTISRSQPRFSKRRVARVGCEARRGPRRAGWDWPGPRA